MSFTIIQDPKTGARATVDPDGHLTTHGPAETELSHYAQHHATSFSTFTPGLSIDSTEWFIIAGGYNGSDDAQAERIIVSHDGGDVAGNKPIILRLYANPTLPPTGNFQAYGWGNLNLGSNKTPDADLYATDYVAGMTLTSNGTMADYYIIHPYQSPFVLQYSGAFVVTQNRAFAVSLQGLNGGTGETWAASITFQGWVRTATP